MLLQQLWDNQKRRQREAMVFSFFRLRVIGFRMEEVGSCQGEGLGGGGVFSRLFPRCYSEPGELELSRAIQKLAFSSPVQLIGSELKTITVVTCRREQDLCME